MNPVHVHSIRRLNAKGWTAVSISRIYPYTVAEIRAAVLRDPTHRRALAAAERRRRAVEKAARIAARPPRPVGRQRAGAPYDDEMAAAELGPVEPATAPPPVEQAAVDLVDVEPGIAPPPAPWEGPVSSHASGRRKVSVEDVREIRQLRAEGLSISSLAWRFQLTRATICTAINGEKPKVIDSPPLPCPETPSLHSLENP